MINSKNTIPGSLINRLKQFKIHLREDKDVIPSDIGLFYLIYIHKHGLLALGKPQFLNVKLLFLVMYLT